eukprot:scaffold1421_cov293-Prasinococcus_capsulatus_cf.AAC.8
MKHRTLVVIVRLATAIAIVALLAFMAGRSTARCGVALSNGAANLAASATAREDAEAACAETLEMFHVTISKLYQETYAPTRRACARTCASPPARGPPPLSPCAAHAETRPTWTPS